MDKFYKHHADFDSIQLNIEEMLESNMGFYGTILQRSVLRRTGANQIEHGISLITGRLISETQQSDRDLDYGELLLIQERLDVDMFRERLRRLRHGWFETKHFCFLINQQSGITENFEGSKNDYHLWPRQIFSDTWYKTQLIFGTIAE